MWSPLHMQQLAYSVIPGPSSQPPLCNLLTWALDKVPQEEGRGGNCHVATDNGKQAFAVEFFCSRPLTEGEENIFYSDKARIFLSEKQQCLILYEILPLGV